MESPDALTPGRENSVDPTDIQNVLNAIDNKLQTSTTETEGIPEGNKIQNLEEEHTNVEPVDDDAINHNPQDEPERKKLNPPKALQDSTYRWSTAYTPQIEPTSFCGITLSDSTSVLLQFVLPPLVWAASDIADIVSDILVAISHYKDGNYLYFGMTLGFVFTPSLAMYLLALNSIIQDRFTTFSRNCLKFLIYSIAIWTLSLWPLVSYLQMWYYGVKALTNTDKRTEYVRIWKKLKDDSLPSYYVIKAFLECAPQLALQLYILLVNPPVNQHKTTVLIQIVSCVLSIISMAGKSIEFRKYIQEAKMSTYSDDRSSNCILTLWNTFVTVGDYLWWFCSIAARMIAIIMFASVFDSWIFLVCLCHVLVMVTWIVCYQPKITVQKLFVSLFVSIMYIFCFIEYKVDFGRITIIAKYAFYYVFMICQNTALVLSAYFVNQSDFLRDVHKPLIIIHYVATAVDLIFMIGYLLHSKRNEIGRHPSRQPTLSL